MMDRCSEISSRDVFTHQLFVRTDQLAVNGHVVCAYQGAIMYLSSCRSAAACLAIMIVVSGCGKSGPTKYPIAGVVKFNGQPIQEGQVTFHNPTVGSAGVPLKPDGTFDLSTAGGLQALEYQVYVEPPPQFTTPPGPGGPPLDKPKVYPNIPQRYREARTTEFKVTVTGAKKDFVFDMKP